MTTGEVLSTAVFLRRKRIDRWMFALTGACTAVSLAVLGFILLYIAIRGIGSVNLAFLIRLPRPVGEAGGGIANAIVGSGEIVALAALFGVPVGVLGGLYLAEMGDGAMGFVIRYCADVLNGVPSIVMGVFAYALVVLPMRHFSALSGSVALAVIMIPLVLRTTEEFVRLVPGSIREAGLALGLPQWKVILLIVLPTASRGIITGVLLSISRIAGETGPLIFTAFGNRFWGHGMLEPMAALPLQIFTYTIAPYEDWHRQAWAAAFILMLVVLGGNIAARLLMRDRQGHQA